MTLQVEASNTIPSFYLQRHSRDVLNQALPPIFMRMVRIVCAEEGEAGNESTRVFIFIFINYRKVRSGVSWIYQR